MRGFKSILAGFAMMLAVTGTAHAATFQIQFSGVDIVYNQATGNIDEAGGTDPLTTMTFLIDGVLVGLLSPALGDDIDFDINAFIAAGTNPVTNATHNLTAAGGQIFDLSISNAAGLWTDITSGSGTFSNASINLTGSGFSDVFLQNLPFGFVATDPVNWSFSSGTGSCTGAAGQAVCTYSGTGEVSWTTVPDGGSTLALLGLGLVGLREARRRFWNR